MKRINFIDVFKGIGVFFVILGHMPIKPQVYSYIFSFQLPIFYFVGGFLYRDAHMINTFGDYFLKKVKRVLIPYFVLCFISAIVYISYNYYIGESYDILDILKSILVSKRNYIYINVPLWFLTSFFTVEILYYLLKCLFNNYLILFIVLFFGYIGVVIFRTTGSLYTLPWTFDASLYFIIYYFIGDVLSGILRLSNRNFSYFFIFSFPVFFISITINIMNLFGMIKHADIIYYDFGVLIALVSYLFHVFISLTGVFSYLFISYLFRWLKILKFIGRNSLYYFSIHMPLYYILYKEGVFNLIFGETFLSSLNITTVGIIYTLFLIIVITPFVLMINLFQKLLKTVLNT